MTDDIHTEGQAKLNVSEPLDYIVVSDPKHRGHEFGDTFRSIGLAMNMDGAGGYTDDDTVVINGHETNPEYFIDYCIHEGLHATFPQLSERDVHRGAAQIAAFVVIMLKMKGVKLPTLASGGAA